MSGDYDSCTVDIVVSRRNGSRFISLTDLVLTLRRDAKNVGSDIVKEYIDGLVDRLVKLF